MSTIDNWKPTIEVNIMEISINDVKNGESYMVSFDDFTGTRKAKCIAKFYKPGSTKGQLRNKFRWIDKKGKVIPAKYAEKIETIEV